MVDMIRNTSGFTLLELLITVVVLSIVVSIAFPSFQASIERNSVEASLSEFAASLRLARTEAIKRGRLVVVCPSDDQVSCSGNWRDGWLVFEDTNDSSTYTAAADVLIRVHGALGSDNLLEWSDRGSAIWQEGVGTLVQYNSRGLITTDDGTFKMCSRSRNDQWARSLIIAPTGGLRYGIDNNNDSIFEDESGTNLSCSTAVGA